MSLRGVASPSLLNHYEVGLVCVGGHARGPAKPLELGVYDSLAAVLVTHPMPEDPVSPI
jgi:hypothetical protein